MYVGCPSSSVAVAEYESAGCDEMSAYSPSSPSCLQNLGSPRPNILLEITLVFCKYSYIGM